MAWTLHGHHIPGTDNSNRPDRITRCGGSALCIPCLNEVFAHLDKIRADAPDPCIPCEETLETVINALRASDFTLLQSLEVIRVLNNANISFVKN